MGHFRALGLYFLPDNVSRRRFRAAPLLGNKAYRVNAHIVKPV